MYAPWTTHACSDWPVEQIYTISEVEKASRMTYAERCLGYGCNHCRIKVCGLYMEKEILQNIKYTKRLYWKDDNKSED